MLQVSDSAIEIPDIHLNRTFDPYFMTKPDGNGLGLATVISLVENHDGHIHVILHLRKGIVFYIYPPVGENARPAQKIVEDISIDDAISRKILLVDKEDLVKEVSAEMLKEFGCSVTAVRNLVDAQSKHQ